MNVKTKLGRAAAIAVAVAGMSTLGLAGVASAGTAAPAKARLDGCSIQTANGHYLTAVGGGGRTTDVIHTNATTVGSWEKFSLINANDGSDPAHAGLLTSSGYFLTAQDSGGRTTDTIHSNATQLKSWEKFTLIDLGRGLVAIQAADGHYLSAVNGGGLGSGDTVRTNATRVGSWETFTLNCGCNRPGITGTAGRAHPAGRALPHARGPRADPGGRNWVRTSDFSLVRRALYR